MINCARRADAGHARIHDDLDDDATAFQLQQVVADAQAHNRKSSAMLRSRRDLNCYPERPKVRAQFPDSEFMARDQNEDFIDGYGFRRTLSACQHPLYPGAEPDRTTRCTWPASDPDRRCSDPSNAGTASSSWRTADTMATDHVPVRRPCST